MAENLPQLERSPSTMSFTPEDDKELSEIFSTQGLSGCLEYCEKKCQSWKSIPVNIAVTGASGAGKSTFINAIRDLKAKDVGAAKTGTTETTTKPTSYPYPANKNVCIWDLPGVGTPQFLRENYLKEIEVENYDCFVIITAIRFTQDDVWLYKETTKLKKKVYFVRSKIGSDLYNEKQEHGEDFVAEDVIRQIKSLTVQAMKSEKVDDRLYLTDSFRKKEFDFQNLEKDILDGLSETKRTALLLTMEAFNKSIVDMKLQTIKIQIGLYAAAIAIIGGTGMDMLFHSTARSCAALCKEWYKQFGLDDDSLSKRARNQSEVERLRKIVRKYFVTEPTVEDLQTLIKEKRDTWSTATKVLGSIPYLGTVVISDTYHMLVEVLSSQLNRMAKASADLAI